MGRDTKARRHRDQAVGILSSSRGCPVHAPLGRGFSGMDGHASQTSARQQNILPMPWGLNRFYESRQLHVLTFSCSHRRPNLGNIASRTIFESALERVRHQHGLCVYGYVVIPEHVHLLVNEPERGTLAQAMQSLKQGVAHRMPYARRTRSGRPAATISMFGGSESSRKSFATYTVIQ
jgi:putative transposase